MSTPSLTPEDAYLIRAGARYACFGDGLCCTDVHGIGPIDDEAKLRLSLVHEDAVRYDEHLEADVMLMRERDGACVFVNEVGCALHAVMDGMLKPMPCRRYPYFMVKTPGGKRIGTHHGCPCRTVGERPPLDIEDALASLITSGPGPAADYDVGEFLLAPGEAVDFEAFTIVERALADALRSQDPLDALGGVAFPELERGEWRDVVERLGDPDAETRVEAVCAWFSDGVLEELNGFLDERPRPWAGEYAKAEARSPEVIPPVEIYRDWLLDELWGLRWAKTHTLAHAKLDWATRLVIARRAQKRIEAMGVREDIAAAEGVMIAYGVGTTEWWEGVVSAFRLPDA